MKYNKKIIIIALALALAIPTATSFSWDNNYTTESYVECNDKDKWKFEYNVVGYNFSLHDVCPTQVGWFNNYNNVTGIMYDHKDSIYRAMKFKLSHAGVGTEQPLNVSVSAWGDVDDTNFSNTIALEDSVEVRYSRRTGNISVFTSDTKVASKNATPYDMYDVELIPENDTVIAGDVNITVSDWSNADFNNTGYSYGSGYVEQGQSIHYGITSLAVGSKSGNITYLSSENDTARVESDVRITLPIPKLYDPMGSPIGTPILINFGLLIVSLIMFLIPQPVVDSFKFIATSVTDIIALAIETATIGAKWLMYIREVGIERLKQLLLLGLIFLGANYARQIREAVNGQRDIDDVATEIFNDVMDKVATLERITYRALDTVGNIASLFALIFNTMVNIYHTIKSHIPGL